MSSITVVIPCYNEESTIAKVIRSLPNEVDEIIVVDNNSTDQTADIAKKLGARVIEESKQGYGASIKAGMKQVNSTYIAVLDGDGQYPSHEIIPMLEIIKNEDVDFVSGNRFPISNKSMSKIRIFGNWGLTFCTNMLFRLRLRDSQSGMWVFKRSVLDVINLESDDMPFSQEIKIRVSLHPKLKISEYQIPYYHRGGVSKLSPLKHGVKNLLFLFRLAGEKHLGSRR